MKAYLTRRYRFAASHRLHCDAMSAQENEAVYGKCNNQYGHGHNYALEVTIGGPVDPITGMVCNLADLDAFVSENILERFGHENLNHLAEFAGVVPTTENLCIALYKIIEEGFRHARIERIRMEETMFNSFEYAGGREIRP
jgi:6-pyruvoyltetrahydropterin/6-carboxytetrahydropterin synthase